MERIHYCTTRYKVSHRIWTNFKLQNCRALPRIRHFFFMFNFTFDAAYLLLSLHLSTRLAGFRSMVDYTLWATLYAFVNNVYAKIVLVFQWIKSENIRWIDEKYTDKTMAQRMCQWDTTTQATRRIQTAILSTSFWAGWIFAIWHWERCAVRSFKNHLVPNSIEKVDYIFVWLCAMLNENLRTKLKYQKL